MKSYTYLLLLLCAVLSAQCSSDEPESGNDGAGSEDYTSYWYYSYEAQQVLDAESLGMEPGDFIPYTVCRLGDTLFVANKVDARHAVLLVSRKTGKVMRTLRTWRFGGEEKSFGSPVEAIVPTAERLYVAERESRIHAFSLPSLEYISCIGDGNWSGQVFQAQALTVKDGLVFARDKDSRVSIYREEDVTPENYQRVKRWRRTAAGGSANNGFAPQSMDFDGQGRILLTDYAAKKIRTLDPALLTDGFENGASIDVENEEIAAEFGPQTLTMQADRFYVTGGNRRINVYDRRLGEWVAAFQSVAGYSFSEPARIYAGADSVLWISDLGRKALVRTVVYKNEIREYDHTGDGTATVRAHAADARSGQPGEFTVDLRTHEILGRE